jgi:hypothetical protein
MRKGSRPTKVREFWAKAGAVPVGEVKVQIGWMNNVGIGEESVDSEAFPLERECAMASSRYRFWPLQGNDPSVKWVG